MTNSNNNGALNIKDNLIQARQVAGVTFSGTQGGSLDESEIPNDDYKSHYLFPDDTKTASSYPVVDADGDLRRGNVKAAHSLGARGGVSASELEDKLEALAQVFDPPIEEILDEGEEAEASLEAKSEAGVTFTGTKDGYVDEAELPTEGYESYYIIDRSTKSDSKYPVVDAEGNLRRGSVRSTQSVDASDESVADKIEQAANALADEFTPPVNMEGGKEESDESDDQDAQAMQTVEGRMTGGEVERQELRFRGTIWASGVHNLSLSGKPTKVWVPPETIEPTFNKVKQGVSNHDVSIGFDHPESDSVAASTAIGELGVITDVKLSESGDKIVMDDSVITNNKARNALEAGDFSDADYSIVGSYSVDTTANPPGNADATLTDVEISRVDIVGNGAVREANVNRNIPTLAAKLESVDANRPVSEYANELRAAAGTDNGQSTMYDFDTEPEDLEAARTALSEAADEVEEIEAQREDLEKYKKAVANIAAAFDLSLEDDDPSEIAASAVDTATEDLRREVAELESDVLDEDTDVDSRVEDLCGWQPEKLEAHAGELARKYRKQGGADDGARAVSRKEMNGGTVNAADAEELEEKADWALGPMEASDASQSGMSASEYISEEYDIDPSNYNRHQLQSKMSEVRTNGGVS